jgi:hypothetical protein
VGHRVRVRAHEVEGGVDFDDMTGIAHAVGEPIMQDGGDVGWRGALLKVPLLQLGHFGEGLGVEAARQEGLQGRRTTLKVGLGHHRVVDRVEAQRGHV